MRVPRLTLLTLALFALAPALSLATDPEPSNLGRKVADFTLPDADGTAHALADLKTKKATVVLFLGTECPINNAYAPTLIDLHKRYDGQGVAFLGVNSNQQDTAAQIKAHATKHNLPFPVLKDDGNKIADAFEAVRTPEAFLLDADRKIVYRGRIDDRFGVGYQRPRATRQDLAVAIDELLAGKTVSTAVTSVEGCKISRVRAAKTDGTVTFAKHVSRVIQNHCQECHRPGQIGPFSLMNYKQASAWAEMIKEVLQDGRMPPWFADPKHGTFKNTRILPKEDRETLLAWIDQGCPKGDDADLPKPREYASEWGIGKPDLVLDMGDTFKVPAKSPKGGVPYKYFVVPTDFKEDVWIQAAEARPGNPAVVHHIIVYVFPKGGQRPNTEDGVGNGWLTAFAPGSPPAMFPEGTAKKIPKGANLVFQMHYTPNGVEQTDRSSVGLVFSKAPPKLEMRTRSINQRRLAIPPGEANYKSVAVATFSKEITVYDVMPHMHLRGKSFEYKVIYPDGKSEILLSVPRFDFGWQDIYRLEKPLTLPPGSRIECTAYFDNSEKNKSNPDPTQTVRWGDQTWEEMMIGFVDYTVNADRP
jgi:peroxiredoxin